MRIHRNDNPKCGRARRGFTLTEILVVLTIIILVLATAVPAFRALTGSRSTDAAQNLFTAMLGRARTMALNQKKTIGVFFSLDPATDRTRMALVELASALDDPDPGNQYMGWTATGIYRQADGSVNPPIRADRVVFITKDNDLGGKVMVKMYRCTITPTSGTGQAPPTVGPVFSNGWWEEFKEGDLSLVADTDIQSIPVGIGVQVIVDPRSSTTGPGVDRYVRTGVILFDPQGRLAYRRYTVSRNDALGRLLALNTNLGSSSGAGQLYSGFGAAIYQLDEFRGQPGADEGDATLTIPGLAGDNTDTAEEDWLDKNTTPLLVNRYTGTLGVTQ